MKEAIQSITLFILDGGFWELICSVMGLSLIFGVVILAFPMYRPIVVLMHHKSRNTGGLPPHLLRGILSMVLALVAVYNIHQHAMSPDDVLASLLPFGDYARIGATLSQQNNPSGFAEIANTFVLELCLGYMFILPVIALDLLNGLATLCSHECSGRSIWVSSALDLISVASLTIVLSCYDTPHITLPVQLVFAAYHGSIVELVLFGLLTILLLGLTMMDMFANSFLMASFGFHIARKIIPATLEPWQDIVMIVLCFTVGLIANIIRSRLEDNEDLEEVTIVLGHGATVLACAVAAACGVLLLIRHVL